ncbi:glycosyltransferase [Patescibacteria group bacterium]|nr:glycosyltransferase [Patescibacteria group bacterium]
MKDIYLSVVIPSYNEMANLQKGVLEKIAHFLEKQSYSYEVIVVDDGSDDGSQEFVEEFIKDHNPFFLIKNKHMGKAGAVTAGMLKADGQFRLFTDMDQATPIEEVESLLQFTKSNFDIVIGGRSSARKGAPFTRKFISFSAIILRRLFVGIKDVSDTQCGFKLFSEKSAKDLFSSVEKIHNGFKQISGSSVTAGFDMELLLLAQNRGYKIKEVPVSWLYVETRRVSPIKDSIEGFSDLIKIRINNLKGKYH